MSCFNAEAQFLFSYIIDGVGFKLCLDGMRFFLYNCQSDTSTPSILCKKKLSGDRHSAYNLFQ